MYRLFKYMVFAALALSAAVPSAVQGFTSSCNPRCAGAILQAAFSDKELDETKIGVTVVFKAGSPIPSDAVLNKFLPLEGHRGPFGRRFKATAGQIKEAFQLEGFDHWKTDDGASFYASSGTVSLPKAWSEQVRVVLGLDNRPLRKPRTVRRPSTTTQTPESLPSGWPPFGFFPPQLAEIYGFPRGGLGEGQSVGIFELTLDEPGYTAGFYPDDVSAYFTMIGISPLPVINVVSVDGAVNQPTNLGNGGDTEVCLDIEIIGSIVPKADITVFFAPGTNEGWYNCFATMLSPPYSVGVASSSYGLPEVAFLDLLFDATDYMMAFEELFASVAEQSTICIPSGDGGSTDLTRFNGYITPGTAQVLFPASCPHALACGGTSLLSNGLHTKRIKEVVWNWGGGGVATGGGVSALFDVPNYQKKHIDYITSINNGMPGRVVPDIAAMSDPYQGYNIRVDYYNINGNAGTSAAAPLWAALVARLNHINGKPLGFINPLLYSHSEVLKKIEDGSNGQYFANDRFDACTGLGVPTDRIVELIKHPRCSEDELKSYHYELPNSLQVKTMRETAHHTLLGNSYQAPQGAFKISAYSADELAQEQIGVTVIFKEKVNADVEASLKKWAAAQRLNWGGNRGPFARHLTGSAKQFCKALGISGFDHWQVGTTPYRVQASDVKLDQTQLWVSHLLHIAGLDTQPLSRGKKTSENILKTSQVQNEFPFPYPGTLPGYWSGGYFPFQLSRLYGFPTKGFGSGQSVAVIELAGGYSDLDIFYYWVNMGISNPPVVTWIGVDGGFNNYTGNLYSSDWIPTADIEIIGAIAPDASIQVVFAPDTTAGLYNALAAAIFDGSNTIVSTVWGQPEANWPLSMMHAIDRLAKEAADADITVIASSGSHGSSDGILDGDAHVDFPASSPHVLAVGTTTLLTDQYHKERVIETAWDEGYGLNASGGGVSSVFKVPDYQKKHGITPRSVNKHHREGRGVPDVSSVGDPLGFYPIPIIVDMYYTYASSQAAILDTLDLPCGTVATPTWAGLVARLKSISKKPLGLLHDDLYKHRHEWFDDITKGGNGRYQAKEGYDLTTGLGVPNKCIVDIAR